MWFATPGAKLYLILQLSWTVFFQYVLKICNFFGTPMAQKKIREPFFLSKLKVQKSKNVHINYFHRNLKIFKDWIKESQKIRKIVIRKFAIFSSGLIFNEKLFKIFVYSKVLDAVQSKPLEPLKNYFSVKIRPELKIADLLITILQIFWDSVIQSF